MKLRYLFLVLTIVSLSALMACRIEPQPPQVLGQVHEPIDFHSVHVYVPKCAPPQYKTVAKLDASKLGNFSSYQFDIRWIKALRKQAAELGANALLLIPVGHVVGAGAVRHGPGFKALAIRGPPTMAAAISTSPQAALCAAATKILRYETGVLMVHPLPPAAPVEGKD